MNKIRRDVSVFPVIPEEEFLKRWTRVQEVMEKNRLDLLVAYADDHAVYGAAYSRWLADFPVHFEPVCIVMTGDSEPILLCGPESEAYAFQVGKIKNVKVLKELSHPEEDYPYTTTHSLSNVLKKEIKRYNRMKRAGMAGISLMSNNIYKAWCDALPGICWVDMDSELTLLRSIKSSAEVAVIRKAYRIAEIGMRSAVEAVAAGVTEREISAAAECAMRRSGAEGTGIDTIVAGGPNSRPILARSTFRRIQKKDLLVLTVAPRYEGYHGAIGRPVVIGELEDNIMHAIKAARSAQSKASEAIVPGILGQEVEAAARKIMSEEGLGEYFAYSGIHSVGVIEFESPIFGPSSKARIEKNMVLSIDVPLFNASWGGLRYEDGFLVTENGAERLDDFQYDIKK